jgi:hypothetical protein
VSCAHASHDSTGSLVTACHELWQGVTTCNGHMTLIWTALYFLALFPFRYSSPCTLVPLFSH